MKEIKRAQRSLSSKNTLARTDTNCECLKMFTVKLIINFTIMLKNILKIEDCNILNDTQLKTLKGGHTARVICDNGGVTAGDGVPSCACHGQPDGVYIYQGQPGGGYILYNILGDQVDSGIY